MDGKRGAFLMIAIGVILLILNFFKWTGESFLLILGAIFVAVYAMTEVKHQRGNLGFLIPGAILLGVGTFSILEEIFILGYYTMPIFMFCIGTSFLLIHLIHYVRKSVGKFFEATWAFIVMSILYVIGAVNLFISAYKVVIPYFIKDNIFAILLIAGGIVVILVSSLKKNK